MFDLKTATIDSIQSAISAKEISYKELTLAYMEEIAKVDSCPNGLNAVMEINPDALKIAEFMDKQRAKGIVSGNLYGIPVLLKDNINCMGKMNTTAGSLALVDTAAYDSDIAANLRQQNAIILGKVNMTEFANWMADDMPSGYSSRGGQVLNPHNREADVSGSSSGSAVAVAANLCTVSVGTETCGSINSPAAANGVVGIKPTAGLLSGNGIIPISPTLDTAGPMARTVKDAATLLGGLDGMMNGYHSSGYIYNYLGYDAPTNEYMHDLERASLRGLRIGVYGEPSKDEEFAAALQGVLASIDNADACLTDNITGVTPENPWNYFGRAIAKHEFKSAINTYLHTNPSLGMAMTTKIKSLQDIIEFNEAYAETCLKYGQSILLECQHEYSGRLTEPAYIQALRLRDNAARDLDKVFGDGNFDILIGAGAHQSIAPLTGFPSGTMPFNVRKNGVPMGLYFIARRFDENRLIKAMYAVEQLLKR